MFEYRYFGNPIFKFKVVRVRCRVPLSGTAAICVCVRFEAWALVVMLLLRDVHGRARFGEMCMAMCASGMLASPAPGVAARCLRPCHGAGATGGRCKVSLRVAAARCLWQCVVSSLHPRAAARRCPHISFAIQFLRKAWSPPTFPLDS